MHEVMNGMSHRSGAEGSPARSVEVTENTSPASENGGGGVGQTFVGEMSIPTLANPQGRPEGSATAPSETSPVSNGRPLTPKPRNAGRRGSHDHMQRRSKSWLREILLFYGVSPDEAECAKLLRIYSDEVYVLYPYLHPPRIWRTHEYLWKQSLLVSPDDLGRNGEAKLSVALVFVCYALGRCTGSSRMDNADGAQSAGWSLYSVAMDIVRSSLDISSSSAVSLDGLQLLATMVSVRACIMLSLYTDSMKVVYLFRLDALDKAERVLAQAISSAHILGLHSRSFYKALNVFDDEMYTRVWWSIYILDRRLSLESGRPFLIQDANVDSRLPLDLSDIWLTQHETVEMKLPECSAEVEMEIQLPRTTVVPYLRAFLAQSQIATDVWRAVYDTKQKLRNSVGMVHDYLDISLDDWWERLPQTLRYQQSMPFSEQCSSLEWWQIKQCIHISMVCKTYQKTSGYS